MNVNLSNIKSKLIALFAVGGLAISGSLISQTALAAELKTTPETIPTLGKNVSEQSNNENKSDIFASEQSKSTYIVSVGQDEWISTILLIFLYLVLPASLGLAIWQHDKRSKEQLAKLIQQVATLERIWYQDPQI